jgi:uncharacterized membrane protein
VTGTFAELWVALIVFFVSHSLPSLRGVRGSFVAILGERGFLLAYSLVSITVTGWLIVAALQAPIVELWPMTVIGMWVTVLCMIFAALFFVWGWVTPNPLSIKIRVKYFNTDDPGLLVITRHPFPWAFAFWGFGHLVSNGDAGPAILFGLLGLFSLVGTVILDARRRREFGPAEWARLAAKTSSIPFGAVVCGRAAMPWRALLGHATWVALAAYVLVLLAHQSVIGVSPLPPF